MQTTLITGVNRGLGYELLRMLIVKNPDMKVIGTVRKDKEELQNIINKNFQPNNVAIMQLDLASEESIVDVDSRHSSFNRKTEGTISRIRCTRE